MSAHMFKRLFPKVTDQQLATSRNKHILLKTYNKTTITHLGMCKVLVEHNNNKKECEYFVVPGNGQVLLDMLDTDMLNITSINIHAIGADDARDSNCYMNMHTIQGSSPRQQTDGEDKCCTNTDNISKLAKITQC